MLFYCFTRFEDEANTDQFPAKHALRHFYFRSGYCDDDHGKSAASWKIRTLAELMNMISGACSGLRKLANQSGPGFQVGALRWIRAEHLRQRK